MIDLMDPLAAPLWLEGASGDGVLLVHGWTGSPAHFRPLAGHLHEAGYTVHVPRLAGHGTTVEDMAETGWRQWIEAAAIGAQGLLDRGLRLHLVGLSMGGVISLLLAPTFAAASVATVNAPQRVRDRRAALAPYVGLLRPYRTGPDRAPLPAETARFGVHYERSPLRTTASMFRLIRAAGTHLDRITCPALVVQSRTDETVDPVSALHIFDGLGSIRKRIVWLERSRHVALLDIERDVIRRALTRHLAGA